MYMFQVQQEGRGPSVRSGHNMDMLRPQAYPMLVQGIRTNKKDPDGHVLFFDTEALIGESFNHDSKSNFPLTLSCLQVP